MAIHKDSEASDPFDAVETLFLSFLTPLKQQLSLVCLAPLKIKFWFVFIASTMCYILFCAVWVFQAQAVAVSQC